jgi:hypothetical protein
MEHGVNEKGDRDRQDLTGRRLQSASKVCRLSEIAFLIHVLVKAHGEK